MVPKLWVVGDVLVGPWDGHKKYSIILFVVKNLVNTKYYILKETNGEEIYVSNFVKRQFLLNIMMRMTLG